MKKAFQYDKSKNLREDLYLYIKSNLYDDSIAIQTNDVLVAFGWSFYPQNTGTFMQRETYQRQKIYSLVDKIMEFIQEKRHEPQKKVSKNLEL